MKTLQNIVIIFLILVAAVTVGTYVYLKQNGKTLLETKLTAALNRPVHVGEAKILFPFGIRFDNIDIENALQAKSVRLRLGLPPVLGRQLNIAKVRLIEPVFYITKTTDKDIVWGKVTETVSSSASGTGEVNQASPPRPRKANAEGILIDYFEVENGTVRFFDHFKNMQLDVGQIDLKALVLPYPFKDLNTKFDVSAVVLSRDVPFAGRKLETRGWINVVAKNMDATAKVLDSDGGVGLSAHLKSVNNDMKVKGKLNIGRLVAQIQTPDSKESSLEGFLVNALKSSGVDIGVDFLFETKMDDFQFDKMVYSGSAQPRQGVPVMTQDVLPAETPAPETKSEAIPKQPQEALPAPSAP